MIPGVEQAQLGGAGRGFLAAGRGELAEHRGDVTVNRAVRDLPRSDDRRLGPPKRAKSGLRSS